MADDDITVFHIAAVETAYAGHAGYPHCEVWLTTTNGETIALRFSAEIAEQVAEKIAWAAETLEGRTRQ